MGRAVEQARQWDQSVLLDHAHVSGFTLGDRELEQEILSIFIENGPLYVAQLADAPSDLWAEAAHKILGAARGIGAWHLAVYAAEVEELSPIPKEASAERALVITELEHRLARTADAIQAFFKR